MNPKLTRLFVVILIAGTTSCSVTRSTAGYYTTTVRCVSVGNNGTQTVLSWGSGINFKQAIIEAQKNAIREILFHGIRSGDPNCQMKPVVPEVNAETRFSVYFKNFFKHNGDYKRYVTLHEPFLRPFTRVAYRSSEGLTTSVTVKVNILDLENELKKQGIIK